jgi:hypothetical protein
MAHAHGDMERHGHTAGHGHGNLLVLLVHGTFTDSDVTLALLLTRSLVTGDHDPTSPLPLCRCYNRSVIRAKVAPSGYAHTQIRNTHKIRNAMLLKAGTVVRKYAIRNTQTLSNCI